MWTPGQLLINVIQVMHMIPVKLSTLSYTDKHLTKTAFMNSLLTFLLSSEDTNT